MSDETLNIIMPNELDFAELATVIGLIFAGLSGICVYMIRSRCTHIKCCCFEVRRDVPVRNERRRVAKLEVADDLGVCNEGSESASPYVFDTLRSLLKQRGMAC